MRSFPFFVFLAMSFFSQSVKAQFLPDNDLHLEDQISVSAHISSEEFSRLIDEVTIRFEPMIQRHGAKLVVNKKWKDKTVNANANQRWGRWVINMFGGMARRPELTPDGFQMVVCHELGHHLAGYPFYPKRTIFSSAWAASEGQSDYFASQVCARVIWGDQEGVNAMAAKTVAPLAKSTCDSQWAQTKDQHLCYRVANAGESLALLLGALRKVKSVPRYGYPDSSRVGETYHPHPRSQCRLDTYFQGALCAVRGDASVIPGRKQPGGQDSVGAEEMASRYSCMRSDGYEVGVRPRCWFKPKSDL